MSHMSTNKLHELSSTFDVSTILGGAVIQQVSLTIVAQQANVRLILRPNTLDAEQWESKWLVKTFYL